MVSAVPNSGLSSGGGIGVIGKFLCTNVSWKFPLTQVKNAQWVLGVLSSLELDESCGVDVVQVQHTQLNFFPFNYSDRSQCFIYNYNAQEYPF